jgi:hypothetical protein
MTLVELLHEVSCLGIQLALDSGGIRYIAPIGTMTPTLREELQRQKSALRQLLMAPPADAISEEPCRICGSHERWIWLDGRLLCRVCVILDLEPMTVAPTMPLDG